MKRLDIKQALLENKTTNSEILEALCKTTAEAFKNIQEMKLNLLNKALIDHGFPVLGEDLKRALEGKQTKMCYCIETREEFYYIDEKLIFTFKY
jgi:hypothetical protein